MKYVLSLFQPLAAAACCTVVALGGGTAQAESESVSLTPTHDGSLDQRCIEAVNMTDQHLPYGNLHGAPGVPGCTYQGNAQHAIVEWYLDPAYTYDWPSMDVTGFMIDNAIGITASGSCWGGAGGIDNQTNWGNAPVPECHNAQLHVISQLAPDTNTLSFIAPFTRAGFQAQAEAAYAASPDNYLTLRIWAQNPAAPAQNDDRFASLEHTDQASDPGAHPFRLTIGREFIPECEQASECDDEKECTTDTCDSGVCVNTARPTEDLCDGGVCNADSECVPCVSASNCNDSNECTTDACTDEACSNANVDDGTPCDGGACSEGVCEEDTSTGDTGTTGGEEEPSLTCMEVSGECTAECRASYPGRDWRTERRTCRDVCRADFRDCVGGCRETFHECRG